MPIINNEYTVPNSISQGNVKIRADKINENFDDNSDIINDVTIPTSDNSVKNIGDETIEGIKTFKNSYDDTLQGTNPNSSHSIILRTSRITKGMDLSVITNGDYSNLIFQDNSSSLINHAGRLGSVEYVATANSGYNVKLSCYKNEVGSHLNATIIVGYDVNGITYATAPSTSTDRTNNTDIVTRDFIPKDTRIVHTTGDETISGIKTFISEFDRSTVNSNTKSHGIVLRNMHQTRGVVPTDGGRFTSLVFADADGPEWGANGAHGRSGVIECFYNTDGDSAITIAPYINKINDNKHTCFNVGITQFGSRYARILDGGTFCTRYSCTRGTAPSSNVYNIPLKVEDESNDKPLWMLYGQYETNKTNWGGILVYKGTDTSNTYTSLRAGYDSNGKAFTYAPTPDTSSNDTNIATTAFVKAQGYLTQHQSLADYAKLASPALTGTPTAPTAAASTNNTQIATTAFVRSATGNTSLNAATSSKVNGCIGISHVGGCVYGNALVNLNNGTGGSNVYAAIWNAGTKNNRVSMATYPSNNDLVYLLSCTNDNVASNTNSINHKITWDANNGILTNDGQIAINKNNGGTAGIILSGAGQNYAISTSNTNVTKGTAPSSTQYWGIDFYGKDTTGYNQRIGMLETALTNDNLAATYIRAYNCTTNTNTNNCSIGVLVDKNGTGYTSAPTPVANDNTTKIATTAWVQTFCDTTKKYLTAHQSLAGYLPLAGGTITGNLTITNSNGIIEKHTGITRNSTTTNVYYWPVIVRDNANNALGGVYYEYLNKNTKTHLMCYQGTSTNNTYSSIGIGYDTSGNAYTWAPTPSTADNSTKIATTAFVKNQGYLTSHQSLSNYVTLNSAQTISGAKTFSGLITGSANIKLTGGANTISINSGGNSLHLYAGVNNFDGATLQMFGCTHTSYAGRWYLRASSKSSSSSTGESKDLVGYPNGTLSWTGTAISYTSDERLKTILNDVPDEILDTWGKVNWGQFKYLADVETKGDLARLHTGLIAQHIKAIFEADGLDICKYGILCHEVQEATENEPATDLWMVRYTEALAMEAAYQRRRADKLEEEINKIKKYLNID